MQSRSLHDYKTLAESRFRRRRRLLASLIAGVCLSSVTCMAVAATYVVVRQPWPAELAWPGLLLAWGAVLSAGCIVSDWFAARKEIDRG